MVGREEETLIQRREKGGRRKELGKERDGEKGKGRREK